MGDDLLSKLGLILVSFFLLLPPAHKTPLKTAKSDLPRITEESYQKSLLGISQGVIQAIDGPFVSLPTLALLAAPDIQELLRGKDDKFVRIIKCESTFRPKVCSYRGCGSGMGLVQFIPGTWNRVIKTADISDYCRVPITSVTSFQTNKSHPVFDPVCNIEAGWWLYQNEGINHWGHAGANWGSFRCWSTR